MDVSQTMIDRVKHAREEAARAERNYEFAADMIEIKSSSTIDIFSDNAAGRVVEIASDVRNAMEELYSSYQTLIQILDAELRPLLSQEPSTHAVKEVLECIRYLNSESNISTNFSGSFNGSSFGNFASASYTPTMECRMIEKFWEQVYTGMPGAAEEDRAYRERQEAERKAAAAAARAELEARLQWEREEREREKREKEEAEERRVRDEAQLATRLDTMRKVARYASRRVSAGYGGFGLTLIALDAEGHVHVFSDSCKDTEIAAAQRWTNIEKVLTNNKTLYGLDTNGSVHVVGESSTHRETACAGWTGLKDLVLGDYVSLGLTRDGRVLATGESRRAHPNSTAPAPFTWTDIDEIFCDGTSEVVGKKRDGSLVSVSYNYYTRSDPGPYVPREPVVSVAIGNNGGVYLLKSGKLETFDRIISPENLATKAGITQIVVLGNHVIAVYHDGTVDVGKTRDNDVFANKITQFVKSNNLNGRILCVSGNDGHTIFVTTEGEVYQRVERPWRGMESGKVEGLRLFNSVDELIDRINDPEKYRRLAHEAEERLVAQRRAQGVCTACGGTFRKMLFFQVCSSCGMRKDY